jgi:hypothetical protein
MIKAEVLLEAWAWNYLSSENFEIVMTAARCEGNDEEHRRNKRRIMKRRIKHNDLTAWFLEDHATLPASYVKSCQNFLTRLASVKLQAANNEDLQKKKSAWAGN